jgi:hydroxymethylpyrimidine kinase/phosphomethylpyrimidine kinase
MRAPTIERSVLTIAGSDSCGGSGIQADLNTFAAFGVYGASVVTAVMARNTVDTQAVESVSDRLIVSQMESVLQDLPICAIKTGMLPSVAGIAILGELLGQLSPRIPLVVDPVVNEPGGKEPVGNTILTAMQDHIFPLATVITPNLEEAEVLTGKKINNMGDMESAARYLSKHGSYAVFLKGGRFGDGDITDILLTGDDLFTFPHTAFEGRFHGTGCALSSAIAAGLALGRSLPESVEGAVEYVQGCLRDSLAPITGHIGLLGHKIRD